MNMAKWRLANNNRGHFTLVLKLKYQKPDSLISTVREKCLNYEVFNARIID